MTAEVRDAAARSVERGDPERWRTAMAAPPAARPGLMALYAFNLEIARAPWVASEPMLAAIRLRWWLRRDGGDLRGAAAAAARGGRAAGGGDPRRRDLPRRLFDEMIDGRGSATPDGAARRPRRRSTLYIDHTAGHLMELAARHLGAEGAALPVVRDFARGAGTAALLARAARSCAPAAAIRCRRRSTSAALARDGLAALARARAHRGRVPRGGGAGAARRAGRPGGVLRAGGGRPGACRGRQDALESSEARARAGLLWRALSGRW